MSSVIAYYEKVIKARTEYVRKLKATLVQPEHIPLCTKCGCDKLTCLECGCWNPDPTISYDPTKG